MRGSDHPHLWRNDSPHQPARPVWGRNQSGISPSKASDNAFLITAPAIGERHGYLYDGPREDGYYHYTSEGQYGDQLMAQGNRAIRDHKAEGRDLWLLAP